MNLLRQIEFLRFGSAAAPSLEEDGRVLHLFKNRAELKKAYGDLQSEIHQLKDRIKQQEGATARVQEMLENLEARLTDPLSGHQALVFYQLRDLWRSGSELIAQLVSDLAAQHEERERRIFLAEFNRQQFDERQRVEHNLNIAQIAAADVREKLAGLQKARAKASRWWHYFKRRDLDRRLHAMAAESASAESVLREARAQFDFTTSISAPDFPGLSVESRRSINLAAIAYADILVQRLAGTPLLGLAGAASRRREPVTDYGDNKACLLLMAQIARAKQALSGRGSASTEVRQRAEQLSAQAKYRSASDVVPTEDSLLMAPTSVPGGKPSGVPEAAQAAPQSLKQDLWDLRRQLLG